jgi:thiol-disulfide isomerase/thioredoxin
LSDPASLLIQKVANKYAGRVKFVSENFGNSKLAERFGVTAYPAVFVDDVLVAQPHDFFLLEKGEKKGRYTPWRDAKNQEKFKADLERMIDLVLAGKKDLLAADREAPDHAVVTDIPSLPDFDLSDLKGQPLSARQLSGKVVVVEFWATWCPPCRSTLTWLSTLKQKYGNRLEIVALAVDSPADQIRATVQSIAGNIHWAVSDEGTTARFGDVNSLPTMFLFGQNGKTSRVLYGAPPDLHDQAQRTLEELMR